MSNSITSTSNNALRITGMATGLDTDTLIKQMMAAENVKVDKLKQNQQYTVWRQEAFRDIIKDFRDLRNSYLLIDSPSDTNMIRSGAYSSSEITSSDKNIVTATALPGAANGVSSVTITQIAKSAKAEGKNFNSSSILSGIEFKADNWNGKTITFTLNGKNYTTGVISGVVDKSDLVTKINNEINNNTDLNGKISATVDENLNTITFNALASGDSLRLASSTIPELNGLINPTTDTTLSSLGIASDTSFSIQVGSNVSDAITLKPTDTLAQAISKIYSVKSKSGDNSSSPTTLYNDIKVSFSQLTGNLTIETRDTGESQSLKIIPSGTSDDTNINILGFDNTRRGSDGQDAILEITPQGSSTPIAITKSSNNFTIDNVTYNLIKESLVDPTDPTKRIATTLTTQANAEDSVKKIKAFIDKYNALVQKINDKLTEKKDYNYKPLTDDQKKEMEEDDIKTWEEKAKKGVLKNDGDLQQMLLDMRNAFMGGMDSAGIRLSEVGIDTYGGFEAVSKPGQLKIDEAKLKKALEERGDQVMKLFIASGPSDSEAQLKYPDDHKAREKYKYDNTGIFRRIESIINNAAGKFDSTLLKKAGYEGTVSEFTNTITKQIQDQDKAISELNRKLYDKQERYYQMFARLETAMNQMNSQQSWLTQQLGQ